MSLGNPDSMLAALDALHHQLPALVGTEGWAKIGPRVAEAHARLRASTDETERLQLSAEVIGLLAPYADAREALRREIDPYYAALNDLAALAPDLGLDQQAAAGLKSAAEVSPGQRVLLIHQGGTGEATSIKVRNLEFEFGSMGELAAGIILGCKDVVDQPNELFAAASALLILVALYKAFSVKIKERETSVFWGFIQACQGTGKTASVEDIHRYTNIEREKVGKRELSLDEVKDALHVLAEAKAVARVEGQPDMWEIKERHFVVG
jgi:hypothetical protein